jgi:hypothetical protein
MLWRPGVKVAWTFVPAGQPIESARRALERQLDDHPLEGPLDRRYLGSYRDGSLVIWVRAKHNPNRIEYSLAVNELQDLKQTVQGQVLAGYDYDDDGHLDKDQPTWPFGATVLGELSPTTVSSSNEAPFPFYEDAMKFDEINLHAFLHTAVGMIPPGSTITVTNEGCWSVRYELGTSTITSCDVRVRPVICAVMVQPPRR